MLSRMSIPRSSKLPNVGVRFLRQLTWLKSKPLIRFGMMALSHALVSSTKLIRIKVSTNMLLDQIEFLIFVSGGFTSAKSKHCPIFKVHAQIWSRIGTELIVFEDPPLLFFCFITLPDDDQTL